MTYNSFTSWNKRTRMPTRNTGPAEAAKLTDITAVGVVCSTGSLSVEIDFTTGSAVSNPRPMKCCKEFELEFCLRVNDC